MPSPAYHHTWEAWHVRPHPARVQAARQQGQAPRRRLRISHDSHGGDRRRRVRDAPRQPARQHRQDGHDGRAARAATRAEAPRAAAGATRHPAQGRSEEHTSELQSPCNLVCRLLLEKKKKKTSTIECLRVNRRLMNVVTIMLLTV